MKAVVIRESGGPELLGLEDLPVPTLERDHEMLVRVKAAGVNPVDTKMRAKASTYGLRLPAVLGCDGAGVVESVGAGVTGFRPGDEVYYSQGPRDRRTGQYAEYAAIDSRLAAKKPASLSFEQAAAVPLVLITAWESLHDRARIKAGDRVLIHAGAGGVGHVAIQLAKLAGAEVATTIGSEDKAMFVESLGADYPIFYKQENFIDELANWTDEQGVDIALDTVGGATFQQTFVTVRVGGDLVTLLLPPADTDWTVARNRNLRISFELMLTPWFANLDAGLRRQGEILREAAKLIDAGKLRVHVHETLPLARAADAHRLLAGSSVRGKVVLKIG